MAEHLIVKIRDRLRNSRSLSKDSFLLIKDLTNLVNSESERSEGNQEIQELVLRLLERRGELNGAEIFVNELARQRGLFPYVEYKDLSIADKIAYEFHKPLNLSDTVFHRIQAEVYRLLLEGENVILSAPTSFGKSLIIDAVLAERNFNNVVIVVPTIALIDETRRRLSSQFNDQFKIITHPSQNLASRNLFIYTQERVIDHPDLPAIDFFIIDEFYKLDPRRDPERAHLLNQAFYRLYSNESQFYLLGPNIKGIPIGIPEIFKCKFIYTDYTTVVSETTRISAPKKERLDKLVELCLSLEEPTLVYCASPASSRRVASALATVKKKISNDDINAAADWVADQYLEEWVFVRALRKGIGLHHGKVPRALQQFIVRNFNAGNLDTLICTSTLIEGVNTKAKNVIIYDNRVATQKVDFFTFNNIKGRSGRMFEHFIGHVYLFYDPPQEELPFVDIPLVSQNDETPESFLIQLSEKDLTERSKERLKNILSQELLDIEVIRANNGLDPNLQIKLAKEINNNIEYYSELLAWNGQPNWDNLKVACELIWEYLVFDKKLRGGVSSGAQLAYRINQFQKHYSIKRLILQELDYQNEPDADAAVEIILEFIRHWATFYFPRYLGALDLIQENILRKKNYPTGDYKSFISLVGNYFLPAGIAALDEYGIPIQIARMIQPIIIDPEDIDSALEAIKTVNVSHLKMLSDFEKLFVEDTQNTMRK